MGSALQHLFRFDAFVQRRVDGLAFFFMRRGHGKPTVRYWTMTIFVLTMGLTTLMRWSRTGTGVTQHYDDVFTFSLILVGQHLMLRSDRKAEASPGTLSGADRFLIRLSPVYKPIVFVSFPLTVWLMTFGTLLSGAVLLAHGMAGMIVIYLSRTPYTPPPAKERVPVGLQPAASEA